MTRALHLFDCAGVARTLVRHARGSRMAWRYVPLLREAFPRPFRGDFPLWATWRTAEAALAEVVHVHFGDRARWAQKWPRRPYVLHLHGTDIRVLYDMPAHHDEIRRGIDGAARVLYSTPDLGEPARRARPDAGYLPNPVDSDLLPAWRPVQRPRIAFASRWDDSKGLPHQLRTARDLVRRTGGEVDVVGLDWGPGASDARAAGVRLVPPMAQLEYLAWLAEAHVVIGQAAGVLAMSELQAAGIGVPVVMAPLHPAYGGAPVTTGPPEDVADLCLDVLDDPLAASRELDGPGWVRREHDPDVAVTALADLYSHVVRGGSA